MKKSLIAMAVMAAAGAASAQSSVTLFGVVDAAVTHVSSDTATGDVSRTSLTTGANRTSRIGFRGIEDLGGGLKVGFWLEAGISADNGSSASTPIFVGNQSTGGTGQVAGAGNGLAFNRRASVSLIGNFGEVKAGRLNVPGLLAAESFDPFDANGVGGIRQILYNNARINGDASSIASRGPTIRISNAIEYTLPPNLGGFNGTVLTAFGENADNAGAPLAAGATEDNGNAVSFRVGYTTGPFDVKFAGTSYKFNNTTTGLSNDFRELTLGGSYDFSVVKLFLAFHTNRVDNFEAKNNTIILSGTAPLGNGLLKAVYARTDQDSFTGNASGNDGNQFSVGYFYNLSKRTTLYGTYAVSDNKGTSTRFTIGSGGPVAPTAGGKTSGFDLGITHAF